MGETTKSSIEQLLNSNRLSAIHPLKLPKIEKADIPDYITCPKYEKAMEKLNQKMERYQSKVDRCDEAIRDSKASIEAMKQKRDSLDPGSGRWVNTEDAQAVARYNDRLDQMRKMQDKIENAIDKHNDLIDKRTEAIEEAEEALQELTAEALLVIDDDIVTVLDRCTQLVAKLANSEDINDLIEAIEICMNEYRIFALFEDLIEENAKQKEAAVHIDAVKQHFASLCSNEQVKNYMVAMYQRNLELVQKNAEICSQVEQTIGSVDLGKLNDQTRLVESTLGDKINTSFKYKDIVDPAELDAVIEQINKAIVALKKSIEDANSSAKANSEFAKVGVDANEQAKTHLITMKSNVEDMKNDIITQEHFSVHLLNEAVIDEFFEKDVRSAVNALRQHLLGAIGEENIDSLLVDNGDRYLLVKSEHAIKQADLTRLQRTLDMIPRHVSEKTNQIVAAEKDIEEAGKVPKQQADALKAELGGRYVRACFPIFGWIAAIGISGRIKMFEAAFRSTNQIYQELANVLLAKTKKTAIAALIVGAILGIGGIAIFFTMSLSDSIAINLGVPGAVLLLNALSALILAGVGKRLRSFLPMTM
jgi:uncharacterized protein YukE